MSAADRLVGPVTRPILILLVWFAGLGAAAQFGKIALSLSEFREIYEVGEVALGFLISSIGLIGLVLGVVAGAAVSRAGATRSMLFGLVGGAAVSCIQSLLPGYAVMIVLRLLEGVCHLSIVVAGPILMARHSSLRLRPAVMTLWSSFFGVSYMVLALIAPFVLAEFSLAGFLQGHGVFMAVIAAAFYRLAPKDRIMQGASDPSGDSPQGLIALHLETYRSPALSAPALGFVFYTGLYIALLAYLPSFVPEDMRSALSVAMPLTSIAVSLTLGVWLLQRGSAVRVVQFGFAVTAASAIVLLAVSFSNTGVMVASSLLMGLTGLIPGASFLAIATLNAKETDRAKATGAIAQMGNVGTTLGPPVMAGVSAGFGLIGVVTLVVLLCLCGIAVHFLLAKRRKYL